MENELIHEIKRLAKPYTEEGVREELVMRASAAQYILIGEASHGTMEFYRDRAELTKRLITGGGIRFVAVEGDWPACYALNRYVKGSPDAADNVYEALQGFGRWPTWMWANGEVAGFAEWLREYNKDKPREEKVGFYGIDVYSLWESMDEILNILRSRPGVDLEAAKRAFECFDPFNRDGQSYGISASLYGEGCGDEVVKLLAGLQDKWKEAQSVDERERALNGEMNALAVRNAEAYYRIMIRHDAESWNVRDRHMVSALEKLTAFYGETTRAVVWEHNTHIGDARATDMAEDGMVNVGQLLREHHGFDAVYAIGYGTCRGTVTAARSWGEPPEMMTLPEAQLNSWEEMLHRIGPENKLFLFGQEEARLLERTTLGHRAIGVVYHPERERGNYVPTIIPKRYNAFIYLDTTSALEPMETHVVLS